MRRRIIAAAAATLLAIGLAGCSSADNQLRAVRATAAEAGGLIAIITPSPDNPFFKAEADAAKAEARRSSATRRPSPRTTTTRTSRAS